MDTSRISTCSIALIHHPYAEAFKIIRDAGYEKVDVLERVPHLSLFPEECDPKALKEAADKHNLQIANLATYAGGGNDGRAYAWSFHDWSVPKPEQFTGVGFSSGSSDELDREFEQIIRTIDLACLLGARSIRVVPGDNTPETISRIVPWFKKVTKHAEEKKIYMGLENEGEGGILGIPAVLREFVEKVGSPYLGVLFEPGNLLIDSQTDFRAAMKVMKDIIVHCHFKDCVRRNDKYELCLMGTGDIDFVWIVEQLEAAGYTGDYSLEYELHGPDDPDPITGVGMELTAFKSLFE